MDSQQLSEIHQRINKIDRGENHIWPWRNGLGLQLDGEFTAADLDELVGALTGSCPSDLLTRLAAALDDWHLDDAERPLIEEAQRLLDQLASTPESSNSSPS